MIMLKSRTVVKLILLVIALAVVIGFALDHYRRAKARAEADRIISSRYPPSDRRIHKIRNVLLRTKCWTRDGTERDHQRIVQLYKKRDENRAWVEDQIRQAQANHSWEWPSSCYLASDPNAGRVLQLISEVWRKSR